MKSDFPRIYVSPEIRRKMLEIAREFRKAPTKGEKNLSVAVTLIRDAIRTIGQNKRQDIPSPLMGEGKGGG